MLSDYSIKDSHGDQKKILKSALKLFVKESFSTSTGSITKDAGVSSGILFHYFPPKNDLIVHLSAKILLEYRLVSVQVLKNLPEDAPEKFQANIRLSRDLLINWGLENWQKFQCLQLFECALLADQMFKLSSLSVGFELFADCCHFLIR